MPRLFTGITIPDKIAEILDLKRGAIKGARWVEKEDFHISLRFIGDIDEKLAREIVFALGRIEHQPFQLCLDVLDIFGAKRPRTLFAGVCSSQQLSDLQTKQEKAMQQIGLPPETRKYAPHVTLARLRGAKPADIRRYMIQAGEFARLEFEVNGFALFSARDSIGGGPYLVEEYYPFKR